MKTEAMIRSEGFNILFEKLGHIDAEKFLVMLSKEKQDYTMWQQTLWSDKSVKEMINIAKDLEIKALEND
jgi:hypothetical protein